MVSQKKKKVSSAILFSAKRSMPIWSSLPISIPIKKTTLSQSSLTQAFPSYYYHTTMKDLYEQKMDNMRDQNYNDDKVVIDKSSMEDLSDDDNDIQSNLAEF